MLYPDGTYRCVDVLYANAYSTNSTDVRTNHADTHVHVQGTVYSTCTWGGEGGQTCTTGHHSKLTSSMPTTVGAIPGRMALRGASVRDGNWRE